MGSLLSTLRVLNTQRLPVQVRVARSQELPVRIQDGAMELPESPTAVMPQKFKLSAISPRFANMENTFTLFPQLPPELRRTIWLLALPTSKVVTIEDGGQRFANRFTPISLKPNELRQDCKAKAFYKIPAPLHTCHESRAFTKPQYSAAFKEQLFGNPVYFDFSKDSLFFAHEAAVFSFYGGFRASNSGVFCTWKDNSSLKMNVDFDSSAVFENVRFLGLENFDPDSYGLGRFIVSFQKLEKLILEKECRGTSRLYSNLISTTGRRLANLRKVTDANTSRQTSSPEITWMTSKQIAELVSMSKSHRYTKTNIGLEITGEESHQSNEPPQYCQD